MFKNVYSNMQMMTEKTIKSVGWWRDWLEAGPRGWSTGLTVFYHAHGMSWRRCALCVPERMMAETYIEEGVSVVLRLDWLVNLTGTKGKVNVTPSRKQVGGLNTLLCSCLLNKWSVGCAGEIITTNAPQWGFSTYSRGKNLFSPSLFHTNLKVLNITPWHSAQLILYLWEAY